MNIEFSDAFVKIMHFSEARGKLEKSIEDVAIKISEGLDISGLSKIKIVESIDSFSDSECLNNMLGEVITNCQNPPDFTIKLVGTMFDEHFLNNRDALFELYGVLRHEMAHIHDKNKIPHIYAEREVLWSVVTVENELWGFTLKLWAEFIATQLCAGMRGRQERIAGKLTTLNMMCYELPLKTGKERFACSVDTLCCIAYLLGDMSSHEELINAINANPDIIPYDMLITKMFDELLELKKTYPQWDDITILKKLKGIVRELIPGLESEVFP